ncbi:MAG TPA: hypothetical protein DER09_10075 [Prolixibacteraceae bacterium]|nr:hypothetical protein [Prolixibacteraceae bacterium]
MKTIIILSLCAAFLLVQPARAQDFSQLNALDGYNFKVYYSTGCDDRAKLISTRVYKAKNYFEKLLNFTPSVNLLILSENDWSKYTKFPVYGMPHYNGDSILIVAVNDNPFWKSFVPPLEQLPDELRQQILTVYRTDKGEISMQAFFDLLAIHELGHAFHFQAKINMQRKWLAELYVNSLLHAYVAEIEPESLSALTLIAKMVLGAGTKSLTYTSLEDIENRYNEIGQNYPNNYGWYQFRWHTAAGKIYDSAGDRINRKWWDALKIRNEKLSDTELFLFLESEIGESVADVMRYWDRDTIK